MWLSFTRIFSQQPWKNPNNMKITKDRMHLELFPELEKVCFQIMLESAGKGGEGFVQRMSKGMDDDWLEYVQPEMLEGFAAELKLVTADVAAMSSTPGIPLGHAEAWIGVINRARMNLVVDTNLSEDMLNADEPTGTPVQQRALFLSRMLGAIQSELVDVCW